MHEQHYIKVILPDVQLYQNEIIISNNLIDSMNHFLSITDSYEFSKSKYANAKLMKFKSFIQNE